MYGGVTVLQGWLSEAKAHKDSQKRCQQSEVPYEFCLDESLHVAEAFARGQKTKLPDSEAHRQTEANVIAGAVNAWVLKETAAGRVPMLDIRIDAGRFAKQAAAEVHYIDSVEPGPTGVAGNAAGASGDDEAWLYSVSFVGLVRRHAFLLCFH